MSLHSVTKISKIHNWLGLIDCLWYTNFYSSNEDDEFKKPAKRFKSLSNDSSRKSVETMPSKPDAGNLESHYENN